MLLTLSFPSSPPTLLQFQLQQVFLPRAQHHIIREHHLPICFFSDVCFSESIIMANRKDLKADAWWRPTSTAKSSLVPAAHLTTVSHRWYISFTSMMYFSGTTLSRMHQCSSYLGTLSYAFSISMNTQCSFCCPSQHLSCRCLSANITSFVDFLFTNPICSSLMLTMLISRFSCTLSYSFML